MDDVELKAHLVALENTLLDPAARRDPDQIAHLLMADFVEFGKNGQRYNRDEILQALRQDTSTHLSATDFELRRLTPDAALLTFIAQSQGVRTLRSSVWVRQGAAWKIRFHQGTVIAGAP